MSTFSVRIVDWNDHEQQLVAVRDEVFINEQNVPGDLERDAMDSNYVHALAQDEDGNAIGTGRLLPDGKIGRMAVLKPWRGKGVGEAVLNALIAVAAKHGLSNVSLAAQTHAIAFYQRSGFTTYGEEFDDADMPHINMTKAL